MEKKISFSGTGQRADIGDMVIYRILPNRYADAVGPFVFLDYLAPAEYKESKTGGTGPHPHRGIATLTYVLQGEDVHFDSMGNHAKVSSGGIQWMKAGSGIVHDENLVADSRTNTNRTHGFQFWINLPSVNKAEKPEYLAIQASDVPQKILDNETGWIKVIAGSFESLHSVIPIYSKQYLYHLHLEAGKQFSMNTEKNLEYAALGASGIFRTNETDFSVGDFIEFDREDGIIEIENNSNEVVDVLVFGGERYTEPIFAEGPFVMNSKLKIAGAYKDFFDGKYGEIKAEKDML